MGAGQLPPSQGSVGGTKDAPVTHDDGSSNSHTGGPAADDDFVLVAHRPVLYLLLTVEGIPAGLLLALLVVEEGLAGTSPGGLVVLDTTALTLDGICGGDDEDDTEGLELGREGAECGPATAGVPHSGEGYGETAEDTLDRSADSGGVVSGELFLSSKLDRA